MTSTEDRRREKSKRKNKEAFSPDQVTIAVTIECKSESMGAPGRSATRYLTDINETYPV